MTFIIPSKCPLCGTNIKLDSEIEYDGREDVFRCANDSINGVEDCCWGRRDSFIGFSIGTKRVNQTMLYIDHDTEPKGIHVVVFEGKDIDLHLPLIEMDYNNPQEINKFILELPKLMLLV